MSVTINEKELNLEEGNSARAIVWLLGAVLLFTIASLYLNYKNTRNVNSWTNSAQDMQILSSKITIQAAECVKGEEKACKQLGKSIKNFNFALNDLQKVTGAKNIVTQIDKTPNDIQKNELNVLINRWEKVSKSAEMIVNNEELIKELYDLRNKLSNKIPNIQFLYSQVNEILLDSGASSQMIFTSTSQLQHAERIISSFAEVLSVEKSEDAIADKESDDGETEREKAKTAASENFKTDVNVFKNNLDAMLTGEEMLGIPRVRNKRAVEYLKKIEEEFEPIQADVSIVSSSTAALFDVQKAEINIFNLSRHLESDSKELLDAYVNYGQRMDLTSGHPYYSAAGGIFILILLITLALQIRSSDKKREGRARTQAEREREQNERNQQAIIRLLDEMEGLADGDLTANATVTEDFTGAIADAMNYTIDQLRSLVSTINDSVARLSNATEETQGISNELAQASKNQAQEITGASAAINEMAVSIEQVSANAAESSQVAEKSVDIAKKGAEVVRNTIRGMDTIREQIQETSKRIKRLGESSQEIGDIVSLINDISDQTNILALNAAIQASMAGEAGRGFAVVADEVQRLAERSGNATKQIEALVKTIQTDTNEAVISMEASTAEVVRGARLAQDAGVALEEIERVSSNLAELIQNISNAARQQAASAGHVSNTMNVIQEITNQTLQGTVNTASSIGKLAELADELRNSVAGFKLPNY